MLHPSYKLRYFRKRGWTQAWIDRARDLVAQELADHYTRTDRDDDDEREEDEGGDEDEDSVEEEDEPGNHDRVEERPSTIAIRRFRWVCFVSKRHLNHLLFFLQMNLADDEDDDSDL